MQQKAPVSDEVTMSISKMFDHLLNSVKSSNLNFHKQETPFAAVISIKKTVVKDRFGKCMKPPSLDVNIVTSLKAANQELCDRVDKLENYASSLKNDLEGALDGGSEKENLKFEKKVKEKETENYNLKCEVRDFMISIENLKSDIKTGNKEIQSKEKEISRLHNKNITKWNMSGPVSAPKACGILANGILKTA